MLNGTQRDALQVEMPVFCFIKVLDSEQRARWQAPVPGEPGALSAIHIRAAQRIYGEAGHQVLCCSMLLIHAPAPSSVLRFQLQQFPAALARPTCRLQDGGRKLSGALLTNARRARLTPRAACRWWEP